jgi:hypothetical protein
MVTAAPAAPTTDALDTSPPVRAPSSKDTPDPIAAAMALAAAPLAAAALARGLQDDRAAMDARDGAIWAEVGDFKRTRMAWQRFSQLGLFARAVVREAVPGDYAEFGIWRGGSVYLVARIWAQLGLARELLGFDSFQGLPEPDGRLDGPAIRPGLFSDVDHNEIAAFFRKQGLHRVRLIKGWFDQTIPQLRGRKLALCHIDADCYESVKTVLGPSWDALSPGGYLICDDFRHPECAGATVAMEEFFARRPEIIRQAAGVDCGCFVRKLG